MSPPRTAVPRGLSARSFTGLLCALSAVLVLASGCKEDGGLPDDYIPYTPPPPGNTGQNDGGPPTDGGDVVLSDGGTFGGKPACASGSCVGACADGGVECAGNCGFLAPVTYGLSGSPRGLAMGDLNGDQYEDLVTVNGTGNRVAVLLNRKNGLFQTPTLLPASGPSSVTLADVDSDQKLDIVVGNSGNETVVVYRGKGDGTFTLASSVKIGSELNDVVVGNFGGGGQSVAVLRGDVQKLSVSRFNDTLQTPVEYDAASAPSAMRADDFNQDGRLDIAITHAASCSPPEARCQSVGVLLGNGDGTFQAQRFSAVSGQPHGILSADLNFDAIKDLMVTDASGARVLVMRGNGDGTFQAPVAHATGSGPSKLALADIDRDSLPDLLVSNTGDNRVSLLPGRSNGSFGPQVLLTAYPQGVGLQGLSVTDFDKDGIRDLAVLSGSGVQMLWGICR
ncbi:VCBS repeat-containing protein [Archangium violaceum]|uniref:FG-GAP repeat domain-containing protein n=1 Tax=Archangium violaceum TaxID=83451 RepID=UPI001951B270|nr:VCBS repeat-containing protein [Archangium violaceum]QRN97171.1 VCBS repeat-containing protein [Archangium violaceum]